MPLREIPFKPTAEADDLKRRLVAEWKKPTPGPGQPTQPLIIKEEWAPGRFRVYVVWDEWAQLSLQERGRIIMDSLEEAEGKEECLRVSLTWGLTSKEAPQIGLKLQDYE